MASRPVPRIFVVDNEYVIASTLAVILDINGFSARCSRNLERRLPRPRRTLPICWYRR
jgi:hypothetical protein